MPADDAKGASSSGRRGAPIRTAPLDASNDLRDALKAELQKTLAPALLVLAGPDVGMRVKLTQSIEVGRDPGGGMFLRDESISWRHVRIEDRGASEWVAVDLGSTNGTLFNGEKQAERRLVHGDRIVLGKTILEFQLTDQIREGFDRQLERLINEDDLSGLWVKRRFDAELAKTIDAVKASEIAMVSVVVMDLDGVKAINDAHGHDLGAFVIGEAGHVIGRALPKDAFATRFGGDEFAAALPGLSKAAAVEWAESARASVVAHVYERRGIRVHPGMSCGVATLPDDANDAEAVFQAADQAMYRAKRAGKNRVAT